MNVLYIEDYSIDAELVRDALGRRAPDIRLDIVATVSDAIVRLNRYELAYGQLNFANADDDLTFSYLPGEAPRYDLVLTDLNLPDGTGLDILSHVRKRNLLLAVVILTGSGQEEAVFGALHAGADDYVTKRGDYLSSLPNTLRSALDHFRLETVRLTQIIRVLYAEPNQADVDMTARELRQRAPHIEIDAVQSAGEVLERLDSMLPGESMIDVLLLDYRLPGMTALDLVKELHQVKGMHLPVVLVTGQGNEEIARLALKLGVHEYMVKTAGYLERLPFALENAYYRAASARERLALLKSEREFHSLADNIPDVISRFDREKRHLYINPAAEKVSGIPASIHIGLTSAEMGTPPHLVALWDQAIEQVFTSGRTQKLNFSYPGKDHDEHFESFLVPEKNSSGKVETVLAIARNITERWMSEQALRRRGKQLQTLIDHFPGVASHADRNLRYLDVNAVFEAIVGLPKEKILTLRIPDLLPPDYFAEMEPEINRVLSGEKIAHEIEFLDPASGEKKFALMSMVPDVAEDGSVQGLFHSRIDITDLKRAQLAVQQREAEMRLIADQFPGILSRLDRDLRIVFANAYHEVLYGIAADQVLGRTIMELSGPERFKAIEKYYRQALAGEQATYEAQRTDGDAETNYWYVTLVPDFAADHTVQGVLVSALDITVRRRMELALLKREQELSVITNQFPGTIARLDSEFRYRYVNDAVLALYHQPREEILGRTMQEIIGTERFARVEGDMRRALAGERRVFDITLTDHPSQEERHAILNLIPDFAPDGSVQGLFNIVLDITDTRRAELAMRERERELSVITSQFPGTIARLDRELRYHFVNEAFAKIFKRPVEAIVGRTHRELLGPENFARSEPVYLKALAGERQIFDRTYQYESGEEGHFIINLVPDLADDGSIQGLFLIGLDVTDVRRAELNAMERERHLSVIANNFPGVISRMDRDFRILFANSHHETEFGMPPQQIVGRTMNELIGPQRFAEIEPHYRKALSGERVLYENTQIRPNGEQLYWIINLIPDLAEDQTVQGIFVNAIDITERRRSEIAKERSEARLSGLINSAMDGILAINEKQRIILFNPAAERIFGYAEQDMLGQPMDQLLPERFRKGHPSLIQAFGANDMDSQRMSSRDVWGLRSDGSEFPLEASISHMDSPSGKIYTVILRDITERLRAEQALRQRDYQLSVVANNFPGLISSISKDFRVLFANPYHEVIFGVSPETVMGQHMSKMIGTERFKLHEPALKAALAGQRLTFDVPELDFNGHLRHWLVNFVPALAQDGAIEGVFTIGLEVTESKQQQERIQRLSRMQVMHTEISSAVVRIHERQLLLKEVCRIVVEQSSLGMAWIALLDEAADELNVAAWWGEFDGKQMEGYRIPLQIGKTDAQAAAPRAVLNGETVVIHNLEMHPKLGYLRQEAVRQQYRSLIALPFFIDKKPIGALVLYAPEPDFFNEDEVRLLEDLCLDISVGLEYLAKAEHINYLAYNDSLTGLPNRIRLQEYLEQLGAQKQLFGLTGIAVMDVARFRLINDSFGRQSGDEIIKLVAARLRGAGLQASNLARTESNSFALVLHDLASEEDLTLKLESILEAVFASPFRMASNEFHLKAKCGAVLLDLNATVNIELSLRQAELALAQAKKLIENVVVYRKGMDEHSAEALDLETRLRRALGLGQFILYYQPKCDLKSKKIVSVEALIRWQDPDKGLIPPGLFIPVLEKTGMIFEVGRWVLRQAAADHRLWREKGFIAPRIAVNVSSLQLGHHRFVPDLESVADGAGEGDCGIDLEITESVIMDNLEENIAKLNAARALGMSIAIDDFGTGYSSLSYLAKLPVTTLKIDRSFVIEMDVGEQGRQLVSAIITLAHSLKLDVVAEGVETEQQAQILKELDCDQMQGYLISRPVPAVDLEKMLTKKQPAARKVTTRKKKT